MKRIIPIVVAAVILALVAVNLIAKRRATREAAILGSGVIEADEVQVSSKIGGQVAEMLVGEGDEVTAGQPLAVLEHQDIEAEVERAQAAAQTAAAALRDLERGSRPEQIEAARARLAQARARREGAERQLATAREGYEKVTEIRQQVDAARAGAQKAEANIEAAKAKLAEAKAGPTKEQIEAARAAVTQAEAHMARAQSAAGNAEAAHAHQMGLETPVIAATTEEAALRADAALAGKELERAEMLAEGGATTPSALDQAGARSAVAEAKLSGASRGVGDAEVQLALRRTQSKLSRDDALAAVREAQAARETAQAQLEVLLAGTREERIGQARAALAMAEADAEGARAGLDNALEVYKDRLAARAQRDEAQAAFESALATERAARAELDLLLAGHTEEAIEAARGRMAQAEAAARAAQARRGYCDIVAPCSGTITEVPAKVGEMITPGAPIVVLMDLDNLWLRAYLSFTSLGQIHLGQPLRVATDALPQRAFDGKVIRISDEAEFTPKDVQTAEQRVKQVYWIKVALGDAGGLLKPGMPGDVLR